MIEVVLWILDMYKWASQAIYDILIKIITWNGKMHSYTLSVKCRIYNAGFDVFITTSSKMEEMIMSLGHQKNSCTDFHCNTQIHSNTQVLTLYPWSAGNSQTSRLLFEIIAFQQGVNYSPTNKVQVTFHFAVSTRLIGWLVASFTFSTVMWWILHQNIFVFD